MGAEFLWKKAKQTLQDKENSLPQPGSSEHLPTLTAYEMFYARGGHCGIIRNYGNYLETY